MKDADKSINVKINFKGDDSIEKKLKQFMFYDIYYKILTAFNEKEMSKLIRCICEYMFEDKEPIFENKSKEKFFWGNIIDTLKEDKELEIDGLLPTRLNRKMKHFIFTENYYDAICLLDDSQTAQYIKALCEYVFNHNEPLLKPPLDSYFELAKIKLNISKIRSDVGRKGRKSTKEKGNEMTYEEFKKLHPQYIYDFYGRGLEMIEGKDWAKLNEKLKENEEYSNCRSMFFILKNYDKIIAN